GVRKELLALKDKDGLIHAGKAVDWARKHPKSWLHSQLEWDDAVAGEKHRIWQIRELIAVHIVDAAGAGQMVALTIDRGVGGYRSVADVLKVPDLREVMLSDALNELTRVQNRYQALQELQRVWHETDRVRRIRRPDSDAAIAAD